MRTNGLEVSTKVEINIYCQTDFPYIFDEESTKVEINIYCQTKGG